jgi:endonuclease III
MDKLFMYIEDNKQEFRDIDYKTIVDCIMEQKTKDERTEKEIKTLKEKLHMLSNDYIRSSKAFLNLFLEREGYVISNSLPNLSMDMEYEEFTRNSN